ncbi:MAG: PAS domain S-box protein [Victivallales bacterium]
MEKSTHITVLLLLILIAVSFPALQILSASDRGPVNDVLVLHSYNQGYLWTDRETEGIISVLDRNKNLYDLHIIYMDAKRMRTKQTDELLARLLAAKMEKIHYEGIMVCDNDAMEFAREHRKSLFKDKPVVFLGINDFNHGMISDWPACTGVAEEQDYRGSCEIGFKLFPKAKRVLVLSDDSLTGKAHFDGVRRIEPEFPGKTFVYWNFSQHPMAETLKEINSLKSDSIILLLSFFRDGKGEVFSLEEAIQQLMNSARVPVFTGNDTRIMFGVLGGKVVSARDQGEIGARIMDQVMHGIQPDAIRIVLDPPTRYTFDYDTLMRFNIPLSSLPGKSIILNRPSSFYSVNKPLFVTIIIILMLLAVILAVLSAYIVQKRRSQKALKVSEEKFGAVFEQAAVGVGQVDSEGNIIKVNRKYAEMLGYAQEEMEGMDFRRILLPDDLNETLGQMKRLLKGEIKDFTLERRYLHKDGGVVWVLLNVSLLRIGNEVCQITILQDITEKKKLEGQLIRSEKLSAVGQLAAGVAHEFNNVLMVMRGNIELASWEDMSRKELRDLFDLLEKQVDRGRDIVSKIMSFARPKPVRKGAFKLKEMFYEVLSLQLEQMRLENISPEMDIPEDIEICADRDQFQQVFVNLFLNARHAMCPKGFGTIKVSAERFGGGVSIRVKDNGVGMSEETKKMIFTPFFTTKGALAGNPLNIKGSGLGLSVCDSIVRMHGGQIGFESQEGIGTTFIIYIPDCRDSASTGDNASKMAPDIGIGDIKILVVDDEPDICLPLARTLSHLGCKKTRATFSPFEALTFIQADPPDLIFLDMMMSGISGVQILDRIRDEKKNISVVLMSGKLDVDVEELKKLGALGFIQKPFGREEVKTVLEQVKGIMASRKHGK